MSKSNNEKKMSYAEFIKAVANDTAVPDSIVRKVFDSGVQIIGNTAYKEKKDIEIRNFGVFGTKIAQGRKVSLNNVSNFDSYTKFLFKPSSHFTKSFRTDIGELKSQNS